MNEANKKKMKKLIR